MTNLRLAELARTGNRTTAVTVGLRHAGIGVLLAMSVAGCGRIGLNDPLAGGNSGPSQTVYTPLPAAPTAPVTSSALPPPPAVTAPTATATPVDPLQPGQPGQPTAGSAAGVPVASTTPTKVEPVGNEKSSAIDRGDLAGSWRVASGSDNCQMGFTLTRWAGGYRAWTKGCTSAEMLKISAWDVVPGTKQVALKSGDGTVVATLANSGQEKYAGTTTTRQPISLSR